MLVFQLQSQEGVKGQENKKINFLSNKHLFCVWGPDQECEISFYFSSETFPDGVANGGVAVGVFMWMMLMMVMWMVM